MLENIWTLTVAVIKKKKSFSSEKKTFECLVGGQRTKRVRKESEFW